MITREVVKVTPDMAIKWLDSNTHNRPLRQSRVDLYARVMREGQWKLTHQGLLFSREGTLLDGQHRLWAVVESKRTIEIEVTRGLDEMVQELIDVGERRRELDMLHLRGQKAENVTVSVAKLLTAQISGVRAFTPKDVVATYQQYDDAINWVAQAVKPPKLQKGIRVAPVLTAITRAYITGACAPSELMRFCQVLSDGVMGAPEEKPIILLRNTLLNQKVGEHRDVNYAKTERAIVAYVNKENIGTLKAKEFELFPLKSELKNKRPLGRVHGAPNNLRKALRRVSA